MMESMNKVKISDLPSIAKTLLIPLSYRIADNRRPDPMVKDPHVLELADRIEDDVAKFAKDQGFDTIFGMMRVRQFDKYAQTFLDMYPNGIIVDLGCGLDTRHDRIDNGQMEWYGVDLPEVIEFRTQLLPETQRSQIIGCSALDFTWIETILKPNKAAYLFLAEGLLPYFAKTDVKRLVLKLKEHFPGSELIFDVVSRFHIQLHSLRSSNRKITSLLQWSPENIREIEAWDEEIRLLSIWNYFDKYEPRLGIFNSLKFIPFLRGISLILRYRLGGLVKDREVNHEPLELNNALYNKD